MFNLFFISGVAALDAGDDESAQTLFYEAAKEFFLAERFDEAISILEGYNELIEKYATVENQAYSLDLLGQCYAKIKNYEKAEKNYEKAILIYPKCASALHNFAILHLLLAENSLEKNHIKDSSEYFESAKNHLDRVFTIAKNNPTFLNTMGSWYEKYSEFLENTIDKDALLIEKKKYLQKAIACYQDAFKFCKEDDLGQKNMVITNLSECFAQYGHHFYRNGNYAAAIEQYTETLELNPEHTSALNQIGMCYFKQQQFNIARSYFEHILCIVKENQDCADAWLNIACTYRMDSHFYFAKKALLNAKNYAPDDEAIIEEEQKLMEAIEAKRALIRSFSFLQARSSSNEQPREDAPSLFNLR